MFSRLRSLGDLNANLDKKNGFSYKQKNHAFF